MIFIFALQIDTTLNLNISGDSVKIIYNYKNVQYLPKNVETAFFYNFNLILINIVLILKQGFSNVIMSHVRDALSIEVRYIPVLQL